jgi:putative ABC transport system ATP-binding protein
MELFQHLNDKGKTIVFVTHEADIARFTKRNIIFRDGRIQKENAVNGRFNATELIKALPVEEEYQS